MLYSQVSEDKSFPKITARFSGEGVRPIEPAPHPEEEDILNSDLDKFSAPTPAFVKDRSHLAKSPKVMFQDSARVLRQYSGLPLVNQSNSNMIHLGVPEEKSHTS